MIWQEFEVHLFSTIINFTARTILIIGASNEQGKTGVPFAQFAGINALYGGNADIVAEICGENVPKDMATFTAQQRNDLERLGFTPSDDGVTWQRRLPWPAMSHVIWDTVRASTLRLRDIGGIESPDQLTYKAWRYPSNSTKNENDIGDKKLRIPELGIRREQQ
jgi:hypothetical protein